MTLIQEEFFDELDKSGRLPRTIELKTVVPDENALLDPKTTFKLFKQGLTESAKIVEQQNAKSTDKTGVNKGVNEGSESTRLATPLNEKGVKEGNKSTHPTAPVSEKVENADYQAQISNIAEKIYYLDSPNEVLEALVKSGDASEEVQAKRIKTMQKFADENSQIFAEVLFMQEKGDSNAGFLLDNLEEIDQIFKSKRTSSQYCRAQVVIKLITSDNYSKFLEISKNNDLKGDNFIGQLQYDLTSHQDRKQNLH